LFQIKPPNQLLGTRRAGGGRPDMAQAGGPDGAKAGEALDAIASFLAQPAP
jgi:alanyl-tRNA synthetase